MKKTIAGAAIIAAAMGSVLVASRPVDPWEAALSEARSRARPPVNCATPQPEHIAACARLFPDAGTP